MTGGAPPDTIAAKERRAGERIRTFLKGVIYYDNRNASIDCTIRDLSDNGARILFSSVVTVPDDIELSIPQRQRTFQARVVRRKPLELSVMFEDQRSDQPRRAIDGDMDERVSALESELADMKRLLKRLNTKVFPKDHEGG